MSWLIYALGGGWGHCIRSLALGRIASRKRPVTILCNSRYISAVLRYAGSNSQPPMLEGCRIVAIPADWGKQQTQAYVQTFLQQQSPEVIIVDTFPRGLLGELVDILPNMATAKILVHRHLHPRYVAAKQIVAFSQQLYDRILIPGELGNLPLSHLPQTEYTSPWLLRHPQELPSREQARKLLRISSNSRSPVIVAIASGKPQELSWYTQLCDGFCQAFPHAEVRCLSANFSQSSNDRRWCFHFPGIECLPAADVAVVGGGYNSGFECLAVGIRWVATPFPRRYDRQDYRIQQAKSRFANCLTSVPEIEHAIAAVGFYLQQPYQRGSQIPLDGVEKAVKAIEATVAGLELRN
ncbi:hypothetical protein [Geitlerinema sp. PCC 9228]|uniref:hypothetical protein n=1 Tax=Geitlerinema sp. PCC 9228 TaxID=111611 RepID=UPI0008F9A051|nr:hypothetical protein [Geitlerinema sp. PCC 9228]